MLTGQPAGNPWATSRQRVIREWRGRTLFIPRAKPERHERVRVPATPAQHGDD